MLEPRVGQTGPDPTRGAIARLLRAIESRDLRTIAASLAPDATWQNVPHEPAAGREAVVRLLAPILGWSDAVRWQVVSDTYTDRTGWVERVDRFVIDGTGYAVRCNGVFDVDVDSGVVASVRDYVDLDEWRQRITPVLDSMASRPATAVVARHLDAVRRGDVIAMAADYDLGAVLTRSGDRFEGWSAIADYFETVPDRLDGRSLTFSEPTPDGNRINVAWRISHDGAEAATGIDRYRVDGGRIVEQTVTLGDRDY